MSGAKSKQKGNSFEREVANYLSDLYGESFIRASHSGAYVGGTNISRKDSLSDNQIKSFKGDIIPPDGWKHFNAEAKSYKDFPFHLVLSGDCKVLDGWLEQLLSVADEGDLSILFMKFNRKGRFVVVPSKYTWVADQFLLYTSKAHGDWVIVDFDHYFRLNKDTFKAYSGSTIKTQSQSNIISLNI